LELEVEGLKSWVGAGVEGDFEDLGALPVDSPAESVFDRVALTPHLRANDRFGLAMASVGGPLCDARMVRRGSEPVNANTPRTDTNTDTSTNTEIEAPKPVQSRLLPQRHSEPKLPTLPTDSRSAELTLRLSALEQASPKMPPPPSQSAPRAPALSATSATVLSMLPNQTRAGAAAGAVNSRPTSASAVSAVDKGSRPSSPAQSPVPKQPNMKFRIPQSARDAINSVGGEGKEGEGKGGEGKENNPTSPSFSALERDVLRGKQQPPNPTVGPFPAASGPFSSSKPSYDYK